MLEAILNFDDIPKDQEIPFRLTKQQFMNVMEHLDEGRHGSVKITYLTLFNQMKDYCQAKKSKSNEIPKKDKPGHAGNG